MRTVVIANAMVEISIPDVLEAFDLETEMDMLLRHASVKIGVFLDLDDVVVRVPALVSAGGELGQLRTGSNEGSRVITIKKLRLRGLYGDMLPAYDNENKKMTFFVVENTDAPTVVVVDKGESK